MTTDTKLTSKQAFWLEHIQAITRTGQSLSAYAQSHGLWDIEKQVSPRETK